MEVLHEEGQGKTLAAGQVEGGMRTIIVGEAALLSEAGGEDPLVAVASTPLRPVATSPAAGAARRRVPEFAQLPTEVWERIFLFMGVAGVAKMRRLSSTCAKIGASVLERGGTSGKDRRSRSTSASSSGVELALDDEDKDKKKAKAKAKADERDDEDDEEEDEEVPALLKRDKQKRRRGEGLWEPHMRDSILTRANLATIEQWAALSRNKRLWRSVRGCPATKRKLLQALQDFFHVEESSIKWPSLFRSSDKEKKARLPAIKSLQTILDVCRSPLLDVVLEMPSAFIAKCLHLLKGAKASRDFATVGELALSRSLPGGIVAVCGELLAGGLVRGAGVKDIPLLLALKHRWCQEWLIDALKRLAAKADVDMLSEIAYSETMVPTSSVELRAVIKRRLVSILSTADFQDVQYLKDCQFEFEGWACQEAVRERLKQLIKQHPYALGHFNCSWLWQQHNARTTDPHVKSQQQDREVPPPRRSPTALEKQFDRFLMATRAAEATQHATDLSGDHYHSQQHNCAGAGRKEGLLAPDFLYWAAPASSRRSNTRATQAINPQKNFTKAIKELASDDAVESLYPAKGMGNCDVERMVSLLDRRLVAGRDDLRKPIIDKLCEFMRTCATVDLENLCCDSSLVRLASVFHQIIDRLVAALATFETLELVVRLRQSWIEFVLDVAPSGILARRVMRRLDLSYHIANADATCMVAMLASPRLYGYIRSKAKHMDEVGVALKRLISTMVNVEELVCLLVRPEVTLALRELDSERCKLAQAVDEKLTIHLVPLASINCLRLLYNLVFSAAADRSIVRMSDGLKAAILHRLFLLIAECRSLDDINDIVGEFDVDSPRLVSHDDPVRHLSFFNERETDALWQDMMAESRALQESIMAALENLARAGMPRRDLRRLPNCPWMWRQVNEREELKFFLLQQSLLSMDDASASSPTASTSPSGNRLAMMTTGPCSPSRERRGV